MNARHFTCCLALLAAAHTHGRDVDGLVTPGLNDTKKPDVFLTMNDGLNAGPIVWHQDGVFPPPNLPRDTTVLPIALGCDGTYSEAGWQPGWNERYPDTDFFDPWVQSRTYFFHERIAEDPDTGMLRILPRRFTLRASDMGGIKSMEIRLRERDVEYDSGNPSQVYDDGPSDFINVTPSRAIASLVPVYYGSYVGYFEKRLRLEPRRFPLTVDRALHFDLTALGRTAQLEVVVEDNAGNVTTGSAYLADRLLCQ